MTITLRPHQVAAVDAIEDAYRMGINRPLVDACVGSGKSLMMAETARRAWERGERSLILAHTRELVKQNAAACAKLGLNVGINAAALDQRDWRHPVISASIQSVYKAAQNFGIVSNILTDECHLIPHSEAGMYRTFHRAFPGARMPGFSGTVFRLQGGSLVEGEAAPFDRVVYTYSILDGIRDGYLVPAFSAPAADQIDVSKLKKVKGEYDTTSQGDQMIALMDKHIAQMVHHGADRRAWLVFEASVKSANAMVERLRQWGISAAAITDKTPDNERARAIMEFIAGRLRALVTVIALTVGFDAPIADMLVMRRRTLSLGLYIQMTGRVLRTITGHIDASIAAGKADALVLDFAGNIDQHGPLDFIRPTTSKVKMVSCEGCGARNVSAAAKCWSCDDPMTKLCPGCLATIKRGLLDCPECGHDMRTGGAGEERKVHLLEKPSGAALIAAFKPRDARAGGWIPIKKVWQSPSGVWVQDVNDRQLILDDTLGAHAATARWIRDDGAALLKPNGNSRNSALQITVDGATMPVPMPAAA